MSVLSARSCLGDLDRALLRKCREARALSVDSIDIMPVLLTLLTSPLPPWPVDTTPDCTTYVSVSRELLGLNFFDDISFDSTIFDDLNTGMHSKCNVYDRTALPSSKLI
jgi:hypothetical protein